jgi:PHD/YefM family antitoxin component YafN of YafNO toxin-antitoxin module
MKTPYNPELIAKIRQSEEDIKAGRTTKIEPADIWNLGMDETDRILANPAMVKRLEESRQQIQDGKGVSFTTKLL